MYLASPRKTIWVWMEMKEVVKGQVWYFLMLLEKVPGDRMVCVERNEQISRSLRVIAAESRKVGVGCCDR